MRPIVNFNDIPPGIPALCIVLLVAGLFWFHSYTGLSRGKAFLALFASVVACGLHIYFRVERHLQGLDGGGFPNVGAVLCVFAGGAAMVFGTAFVLRLWGRWVGEKATAEERLPGMAGVRAWFSTSNVIVGAILVLTLWFGFDISPLLSVIGIGAALSAAPLLRMESPTAAPAPVPDDLSAEREKIVSMLQAGKLTAEESAELLQALGGTSRTPPRQVPLTGGQRLMLIGAALVALGFFLPWITINPGAEAGRMMSQFGQGMGMEMPGGGFTLPNPQIKTPTVSYAGGDMQRGLGWAVLALALGAALLPYVATALDAATARTVRLLCLGVGGFIVLYLLSQNLRFTGIGLVMAVGGYALEAAGALRERRAASAAV